MNEILYKGPIQVNQDGIVLLLPNAMAMSLNLLNYICDEQPLVL